MGRPCQPRIPQGSGTGWRRAWPPSRSSSSPSDLDSGRLQEAQPSPRAALVPRLSLHGGLRALGVAGAPGKCGRNQRTQRNDTRDEVRMRKGAMVFQLVRNTTAIWRNAARYCWFKMDLFISKLYTNPARERNGDVRGHQSGTCPPTALQHPRPLLSLPQERNPALQRGLRAAPAWKEGSCPHRSSELRVPAPAMSRESDPWKRGGSPG